MSDATPKTPTVRELAREAAARVRAENAAAEASTALGQLRIVLEATADLVAIEGGGGLDYANPAARGFFGLGADGEAEVSLRSLVSSGDRRVFDQALQSLEDAGVWSGELSFERADGAVVPFSTVLVDAGDDSGVLRPAALCRDLSIQKSYEADLEARLYTDDVTRLPNRKRFLEDAAQAIRNAGARPESVGLLVVDLDRFRLVNDTLGPEAGDRILSAVADRIQGVVRPEDVVARLGADEFAVLCEGIGPDTLAQVAERVRGSLDHAFTVDRRDLYMTASVGMVAASGRRNRPETLLQDASAALHRAKDGGRNRAEAFDPVRRLEARARLEIEQELRSALRRGELKLVYQKEVWLGSGDLVCLEALLRWTHPKLGPVSPEEFVPIAESTGLMLPIGEWVVAEVCRQIREWEAEGLQGTSVSVNVSPRQLASPHFVERVRGIVESNGVKPEQINLEVTESMMVDHSRTVIGRLRSLREAGFTLILDDFGTGYSSLSQLRNLPFSVLKIDKSFVLDLIENPRDRPLVDAMIRMAHALGRMVVAEGVESQAHADVLRELSCEMAQGWHFGRPASGAEITELLLREAAKER